MKFTRFVEIISLPFSIFNFQFYASVGLAYVTSHSNSNKGLISIGYFLRRPVVERALITIKVAIRGNSGMHNVSVEMTVIHIYVYIVFNIFGNMDHDGCNK